MKSIIHKILTALAILMTIFLGGFSYSYIFWNHPYMGGYPDVAVFAQSATQTIARATITSEGSLGGMYATQLFPFLPLETAILTLNNKLETITNLWILQQILPFIYIMIFFIIGRHLLRSNLGGILAAFLIGTIADLPIFDEQSFSRFISTYMFSFIFLMATIAFLPILFKLKYNARLYALTFILGTATLFSHHHFGPIRLFAIFCSLTVFSLLLALNHSIHKKQAMWMAIICVFIVIFFILTNLNNIGMFFTLWLLPQIFSLSKNVTAAQTETSLPIQIPPLPILSKPILIFLTISSIIGLFVYLLHIYRKNKKTDLLISQSLTASFLFTNIVIHSLLFFTFFLLPNRHLREASTLAIPFAVFLLLYCLKYLPKFASTTILTLLLISSSTIWFPQVLALEKSFNTSWGNVSFLNWAQDNIPINARVVTDPFSLHILQSNVTRIQMSGNEDSRIYYKHILEKNDRDLLEKSLRKLCPDLIIIDPRQTSQFFNIQTPSEYYKYPDLMTVVFDNKSVIALKVNPKLCETR